MPDTRPPALLRGLDAVTDLVGRTTAWLVLVMMAVQFAIVVMRYVFGIHSIALQESVMYMHAMVFMLGAAWTLQHDGHVRVDIFYRKRSPRSRASVDLFGTLFLLLPVTLYILLGSLGYVSSSWAILERSPDGGIPGVFLLKSLILAMAALLLVQGIAQLIRQTLIRSGRLSSDTPRHEEQP
ncbi:TRAP transporter small permease subunit [Halomonas sp. KAO]|uniref:TRAP transporter small permease subunit n=1 Tax=unclassified Halomonas TaxID=2609666 RepID=UPI0018A112EE|nr:MULTISPECIES: TRAP transporter small permease subunit [unclassified Halomonas]MBF7053557.1 TRAP transporter small permease subunit [Halomonas sp. KAO]MDT0500836.1 TRAP transporter small permease subunit [Halomonas sp. PAR7]MDT0512572.1 TRAP transporter small permease subunit [Halomonas sp. LES1]MDT0592846.1 TRAP transporter small permease subunit [Halomonas sp. PAR8]